MATSMDDILSEPKEEKVAPPEAPAPDPAAEEAAKAAADEQLKEDSKHRKAAAREKEAIAQGKVRDPDTGQFVSPDKLAKEEPKPEVTEAPKEAPVEALKPATPAQPEWTERERGLLRTAQEERKKRQEAEAKAAAVPAAPEKTFFDDPDGMIAKMRQEFSQQITGTRLQTAEMIARSRYQDFDEKVAYFATLAQQNPGLAQQMVQAPDPAEFVYRTAKAQQEWQEVGGSLEAYKAKIMKETEEKVRAKIEAELTAKAEKMAKERSAIPSSLSEARSTGGAAKTVWSGPTSIENILKG